MILVAEISIEGPEVQKNFPGNLGLQLFFYVVLDGHHLSHADGPKLCPEVCLFIIICLHSNLMVICLEV